MNGHAAVLLLGLGDIKDISDWALPQKLANLAEEDGHPHGIYVGGMLFATLDASFNDPHDPNHPHDPLEKLKPFNAVIICGLPDINDNASATSDLQITHDRLALLARRLFEYVNDGGGLYMYGHSFNGAGSRITNETLNTFLNMLAQEPQPSTKDPLLFEELRDPTREVTQSGGMGLTYARADKNSADGDISDINVSHPTTTNVSHFWYPVGVRDSGKGPWTMPLVPLEPEIDSSWTPLIRTSEFAESRTLSVDPVLPEPVGSPKTRPSGFIIYAAKTIGNGRVILNGSESTISFFNYHYSPYANDQWGNIGMEKGLKGIESDGLKLLVSSLEWLTEPSMSNPQIAEMIPGGFVPPPRSEPPDPVGGLWLPVPTEALPIGTYFKGVIGAVPALVHDHYSGKHPGSVEKFVLAAQKQHLDFLVLAADFEVMEKLGEVTGKNLWGEFQEACDKNGKLLNVSAIPALLTRDPLGNRFITTGPPPWPQSKWLSMPRNNPLPPPRQNRIHDHSRFWMSARMAFRAPYLISKGSYPSHLYSAYRAFPVRTYVNNELIEDQFEGLGQDQEEGNHSLIFVMTLLDQPDLLATVPEYTYLLADIVNGKIMNCFTEEGVPGGNASFVSNGPLIEYFATAGGPATPNRQTFGRLYHPGSERWRLHLRVRSSHILAQLKSVILKDRGKIIRHFSAQGRVEEFTVDLLQDGRHVLTVEVEDTLGHKAITGSLENNDQLMTLNSPGDRCNRQGTQYQFGRASGLHATSVLNKVGSLAFYAPVSGDKQLPGVDGSGLSPNFFFEIRFEARPDDMPVRPPVHQTLFPYESADVIIFDTPMIKQTDDPVGYHCHMPYIPLIDSAFDAHLTQYYFYRQPALPSAVLADMSMTFPNSISELPVWWNEFTQLYTSFRSNPARFTKVCIVRADNNTVETFEAAPAVAGYPLTMNQGDFFLIPSIGEGFFVRHGHLDILIEITLAQNNPEQCSFGLWTGKFDSNTDPVSLVGLMTDAVDKTEDAVRDDWIKFRDDYGLTGKKPGYSIKPTQGKVLSQNYLLHVQAENFGVNARISSDKLSMRIPMRIDGLNQNWTAGKVDLDRHEWFPLAIDLAMDKRKSAYTTLTQNVEGHFYIGNLVTTDNPDVFLTLLPNNESGDPERPRTVLDIHNPTDKLLNIKVTVPVETFLAKQQTKAVLVHKGSTKRIELDN